MRINGSSPVGSISQSSTTNNINLLDDPAISSDTLLAMWAGGGIGLKRRILDHPNCPSNIKNSAEVMESPILNPNAKISTQGFVYSEGGGKLGNSLQFSYSDLVSSSILGLSETIADPSISAEKLMRMWYMGGTKVKQEILRHPNCPINLKNSNTVNGSPLYKMISNMESSGYFAHEKLGENFGFAYNTQALDSSIRVNAEALSDPSLDQGKLYDIWLNGGLAEKKRVLNHPNCPENIRNSFQVVSSPLFTIQSNMRASGYFKKTEAHINEERLSIVKKV